MSRLPNPLNALSGKDKVLYEHMSQLRGHIDGMYLTLLNHPTLTEKVSDLGGFLRFNGELPDSYREFAILYCAKLFNAEYEWIKHVPYATKAGLSPDLINTIRSGSKEFEKPYSLLASIVECALHLENIPENLQSELIQIVGIKGLLELVVLVNFYRMIAGIIFCFDVPLPAKQ